MRVALVHDYIKEYGGAERVLEALHEIWPNAPVFTTIYLPSFLGPHRERFKGWDIRTSFLQYVPFKAKLISVFRLIALLAFRLFDFSKFDVVIVSQTGAYFPNAIRKGKAVHICYTHTPPRYLYGYATAREWKKNLILRSIGELFNHFLRIVDFKSANNVDYFIANSKEVQARIMKFYRREAVVIYPPVEIINKAQNTRYKILNTQYYLAGGRLARPKHIDLIVQACKELNVPLKVFGRDFAGYCEELKAQSAKVEFVGEVSEEEKWELMRNARAYIFASEDEDFGITPVEAMASGTPVIAYRSGGVIESVIDGKTGVFFDELTVDALVKAIKQLNNKALKREDCIRQAKKFSKERFQKETRAFMVSVT